jgi:hypothetical protein
MPSRGPGDAVAGMTVKSGRCEPCSSLPLSTPFSAFRPPEVDDYFRSFEIQAVDE